MNAEHYAALQSMIGRTVTNVTGKDGRKDFVIHFSDGLDVCVSCEVIFYGNAEHPAEAETQASTVKAPAAVPAPVTITEMTMAWGRVWERSGYGFQIDRLESAVRAVTRADHTRTGKPGRVTPIQFQVHTAGGEALARKYAAPFDPIVRTEQ